MSAVAVGGIHAKSHRLFGLFGVLVHILNRHEEINVVRNVLGYKILKQIYRQRDAIFGIDNVGDVCC